MSTYRINFDQIRQHASLGDLLGALENGLSKFGIDYYLVGAVSRDIWMSGINKITPRRTTGDIDFAVFINDKGIYEELKEYLINVEGFTPYSGNAFVIIWKDGTEVDLLPFGAIEDEHRQVTVKGNGYTNIHVEGFKEVYDQDLPEIEIGDGHHFKVCTLPGIVLLKLIAWDDRPEARRDDIKDISDILNNFFDMHRDIIWEHHHDLFEEESVELLFIAARVMGREIRQITGGSQHLNDRVYHILKVNTEEGSGRMALIMLEYFDTSLEECYQLIKQLRLGFEEITAT
jgi:predicted nucleotidyltransferase